MCLRDLLIAMLVLLALQVHLSAQSDDSIYMLTAIVYDEVFHPLPASHVINLDSHQGDVTDSLGMFSLPVRPSDMLLIRNIAFQDTMVSAALITEHPHIQLKRRYYQLQEARIFEWGSTYTDFREAMIQMENQQTLGESMDLPRQDPDYVPYDMDPEVIKSPAFLITSPISYFYQNFNKHAKSARKVYWLKKNQEKIDQFAQIISGENLASITGLTGNELNEFQAFLNDNMECDFKCSEFQLYSEIHALWETYKKIGN
jgi:hypothetical protein